MAQLFSAPLWKLRENERKRNAKSTRDKKPSWARTQEDNEHAEEEELTELLDFTSGLDFETYIDDLEVRTLLQNMKERISKLKGERPRFSSTTTASKA
jgi:hypothetical protein